MKSVKSEKLEKNLTTVDICSKAHSRLRALSGQKKLVGENYFLYEIASEAIEDYLKKHKRLLGYGHDT